MKFSINQMSHGQLLGILLALAGFLFLFGNDAVSLTHPDEVFYAQSAKEMIQHDSWMTPYIFDKPQFEKPILFYWLLILAFKWWGVTAWAARFWPAVFGILGVGITYWLAFMLFGRKQLAFLSGFILMTSFIYFVLAKAVLTDMVFSILVTITLSFFYFAYSRPEKKELGLLLCFVFTGISVLTKGALGIILPWAVILIFLLRSQKIDFLKSWAVPAGVVLFLLISVPWHWFMIEQYGSSFIREYWQNVHLRRIFEAEHMKSNTWYFYLMTIAGGTLPWSFFLVPLGVLLRRRFKMPDHRPAGAIFPLLWVGLMLLIVQLAQSKLASYIFPVFPPLAILLAYFFDQVIEHPHHPNLLKSMRISSYAVGGLFILVVIATLVMTKKFAVMVPHPQVIYIFDILIFSTSIFLLISLRQNKWYRVIASISSITFLISIVLFFCRQDVEPWVSCKEISEDLKQVKYDTNACLLTSKFFVRGIRFYTDQKVAAIDINGEGFFSPHPIKLLDTEQGLVDFLKTQPETICVVKKGDMENIRGVSHGRFNVENLSNRDGQYILRVTSQSIIAQQSRIQINE